MVCRSLGHKLPGEYQDPSVPIDSIFKVEPRNLTCYILLPRSLRIKAGKGGAVNWEALDKMSNRIDQWKSHCLPDAVHMCQGSGGRGGRWLATLKAFQALLWQLFQL